MAATLTSLDKFNNLVKSKIGPVTRLEDADLESSVLSAVLEYSRERPYRYVQNFTGDGATYSFTLTNYVSGFSSVLLVEYPSGNQQPYYVKETEYFLYQSATTTTELRLRWSIPSSAEVVKVTYTGLHVVNSTSSTIPEIDERAVASLAAARVCLNLAAIFTSSGKRDDNPQALGFKTKADDYSQMARRFWLEYKGHMGAGIEADFGAVTVNTEYDINLQPHEQDRIFHTRRWR